MLNTKLRHITQVRKAAGLEGPLPLFGHNSQPVILPMLPELDYPLQSPSHLHGCGPLLLPSEPVETTDEALAAWIQRDGPIVLINRGSHLSFSDQMARHMAYAIRQLRSQRPDVRVLWKLRREQDITDATFAAIQRDIEADQVRIVDWLQADPLAILRTGRVICFVHHGGANSWFEAAQSGVAQLILPGWHDCWDWAVRTEHLGVGVWGNRGAGLALDGNELAAALLRVCQEPHSDDEAHEAGLKEGSESPPSRILRTNAQRLAARLSAVNGSRIAADHVLRYAQAG